MTMAEVAGRCFLFRHLDSPAALRKYFRENGDTFGDMGGLKSLPYGTKEDWQPRPGSFVGDSARTFLGGNGEPLLQGMLQLDPG